MSDESLAVVGPSEDQLHAAAQALPLAIDESREFDVAVANARLQHEVSRLRLENEGMADDIQARKRYGRWIFGIASAWMGFIALVIGDHALGHGHLPNDVIIAMLGTTTLNVLGLATIVAKYLFPARSHE